MTIESDLVCDILPFDLPWVTLSQPKIRNLHLVTILKGLSEDTILISNTITPGWDLESSERIEEACGESSKTTVSECSIMFLLIELLKIVTHIHEGSLEFVFEVRIYQGILKSSAHEELKGEVENSLAIICCIVFVCVVPGLKEPVTHGVSSCLVSAEVVEVKPRPGERILDMVDDLPLDGLDIGAKI